MRIICSPSVLQKRDKGRKNRFPAPWQLAGVNQNVQNEVVLMSVIAGILNGEKVKGISRIK